MNITDLEWKTMTGRVVRLGDMADTHIANALAFVTKLQLKWQDEAAAAASPGLCSSDSMAAYHAGEAMDRASEKANYYGMWAAAFKAEQKRREEEALILNS